MTYSIRIDNTALELGNGNLYFCGYINQDGKLLFDDTARQAIASSLDTRSPIELFNCINGAFRFIFYKDNFLYFSVDHFGGYSLFYRQKARSLELFDNPMQVPDPGAITDRAVSNIIATGFTLGQDTVFSDLRECLPATLYKYDLHTGKLTSTRWFGYYSFNEKPLENARLHDLINDLFPSIEQGEYTLSLSGGIDSRLLLGALLNKGKPFQTFSFGSELNQDRHIAARLAEHFQVPNHKHYFTPEVCRQYFSDQDLDFILKCCTFGRSLPNETDLISSRLLDPQLHIIVKGFGGDWLTGRYLTPHLLTCDTEEKLTAYLVKKYYRQTCISSPAFKSFLLGNFTEFMQEQYYPHNPGLVSSEEQWNLQHNEFKYIVNTLAYYKARGFRFYLPYFDRRLMHYFSRIRYIDKIDQNGYFKFLSKHYFLGKLSPLREIPTLRGNFLAPFEPTGLQKLRASLHELVRDMDEKKLRKRYVIPTLSEYGDSLMLFTQELKTLPYLKQKVGTNFPSLLPISEALYIAGCPQAATHLKWLSRQATSQLNINALSLCKFFANPAFLQYLNSLSA